MRTTNILLLVFFIAVLTIIQGCSSGRETTSKRGDKKEETAVIPRETIKNIELEERNYIRNAKIKSIDRLSFDLDQEGKPVNRKKLATILYDESGFQTETLNFDFQGKAESIYTYTYDKNGRRISTLRSSATGEAEKKYTYNYNKFGNKFRSERFDMYGTLEKYYEYKYDDEGNLIEEIWYDADGKQEYRIEYDYSNGRKTEARSYDGSDDLINIFKFLYDQGGNLVEESKMNPRGKKTGIIQYIYQYY